MQGCQIYSPCFGKPTNNGRVMAGTPKAGDNFDRASLTGAPTEPLSPIICGLVIRLIGFYKVYSK